MKTIRVFRQFIVVLTFGLIMPLRGYAAARIEAVIDGAKLATHPAAPMNRSEPIDRHMKLADRIFSLSSSVRYVAIYRAGKLESHQRPGVTGASSGESDKFEELFVNPVIIKMIQQRGNYDCGGAKYVIIRYGHFFQLVMALPDGHVSICFEPGANPLEFVDRVEEILT